MSGDPRQTPREPFRLGARWIKPGANEIGDVRVEAKSMAVLVALADTAPAIVSAAELLDRVWPKVVVVDNVVHQAVAQLRKALGDDARAPRYIESVPRRGYRLVAEIERAVTAAGTPSRRRHNLPAELTSFIGREREIANVGDLLTVHRLVTLTGVGGCGKTRLALTVANARSGDFPDGVWLVELAPLTSAPQVVQAVAKVLHQQKASGESLHDSVLEALADKRLLLLLDNCEHLIDACAQLAETLLSHSLGLHILTTSREALGIGGEHAWRVEPLDTPDPRHLPPLKQLGENESVRLFIERVLVTQPTFALTRQNAPAVAQICSRVDGIPLAIELAAVRARDMSVEQIATRLGEGLELLTGGSRTAPPRQRTLLATLDWSYGLLPEPARVLLRRLAVFAGAFTLEAAEAVGAGAPLEAGQILDLLTRLVDQSMVQVARTASGDARYRLLETIRQYGNDRLLESSDSPRAYTPKHLADKILQSRSALEGERKQVTVLFAGVKDSMGTGEPLDPEQWRRILGRFFQIVSDGVHRFEGTVSQYTNDGVMALFGAPIAHEDHVQRACYAALALRDALRELAREVKRRHGLELTTRMGINSGEVVVAKIGDDLRMDYTAQGHTVTLAQGMELLAASGSIYLAAHTATLARGYFAVEDLGDFDVKGAAEPVRVFELHRIGTMRSSFDLARARGLTRFVGRKDEMARLDAALEQVLAGSARTVGIIAPPGIGKSRLCYEFLERCRAHGLSVTEARGVAHGKQLPLLAALQLMRSFFGIAEGDSDRATREKIAGRVLLLDETLRNELPILFDLLGVSDPALPLPALKPEALQRRMHAAVRAIVRANGRVEAGVLLVEDLHWLDPASDAVVAQMIAGNAESRGLVLVNFRPEYRAHWMQEAPYQQLSLSPLSEEALRELLRELLGHDQSIAALPDAIHERTRGNPFFVEEIVRSLIEDGSLEGVRGAYRLTRPVESLPLPSSVHSVLAARIDRLPERDKHVLQAASVIGKSFGERILAHIVELSDPELQEALRDLQNAEFLYETALYPEREYIFKHPLTQEVAERSQLRERRRLMHAAVARAVEKQHAEHLDERSALLAHHWEEAGDALNAARWHRRGAEWVARTDFAAATHHWGRVRALLRELPDNREAAALGIAAYTQLLNVSWRVGTGLDEARALLEEGRTFANAIGDRSALLKLAMVYSRALNGAGDVAAYLELALENRRAALEIDDIAVQANACAFLAVALGHAARFPEALQIADEGLARFPRHIPFEDWIMGISPHGRFSFWRGISLGWMGRLPEALEEFGRCRRLAVEDGTPEVVGYALYNVAEIAYHANDADLALASAQESEEISRALGEPPSVAAHVQLAFVYAHLAAGRPADAVEAARAALDLHARVDKAQAGMSATLLAEALLQAGDLSAAQSAASDAIAIARRLLRGTYEAVAHGVMARALLRRNGAAARDAVEAALANAAALIERCGARTLAPALCEWRAELAVALGDYARRRQLLREAQCLYQEIGAPLQGERIARELAATP